MVLQQGRIYLVDSNINLRDSNLKPGIILREEGGLINSQHWDLGDLGFTPTTATALCVSLGESLNISVLHSPSIKRA